MSHPHNITLHSFPLSGHGHKVSCLLSFLGLPVNYAEVDLKTHQHQSEAFTALNPKQQVPVLVDSGTVICDSHAILVYLALQYDKARAWYPKEAVLQAEVQRFLALSSAEVVKGPCQLRGIKVIGKPGSLDEATEQTLKLFSLLEQELEGEQWLVGAAPTIADIAIYSYVAMAMRIEPSLNEFKQVKAWVTRFENLPKYVPLPEK